MITDEDLDRIVNYDASHEFDTDDILAVLPAAAELALEEIGRREIAKITSEEGKASLRADFAAAAGPRINMNDLAKLMGEVLEAAKAWCTAPGTHECNHSPNDEREQRLVDAVDALEKFEARAAMPPPQPQPLGPVLRDRSKVDDRTPPRALDNADLLKLANEVLEADTEEGGFHVDIDDAVILAEGVIRLLSMTPPAAKPTQLPMQPVAVVDGIIRFRQNQIVRWLLDEAGEGHHVDMNRIAVEAFPVEDREQFAQLIGYSLNGFADLSYVRDETYAVAQAAAAEIVVQDGAK